MSWTGRIGVAALLFLFAAHVAVHVDGLLVIDSGRDVTNAWLLANGEHFPLLGPSIYGTWSLGPVWFYLLAIPLWFDGQSLTPLALWIGLLGSAKIPLAYIVGRSCYGPSAGIVFAAAIGMPGWTSVSALALGHTSVVESAVLAALVAAQATTDKPTHWRLALTGLFFALAIHAHPTALIVGPWVVVAVLRVARSRGLGPIGVAGAAFVAPWLPMLFSEAQAGWPQLQSSQRYLGAQSDWFARLAAVPDVFSGLISGWAPLVSQHWIPALQHWGPALSACMYAVAASTAVGFLIGVRREPGLSFAIAGTAGSAVVLACMLRPDVPAYMLFAAFPFFAWLVAHGTAMFPAPVAAWIACLGAVVATLLQLGMAVERNRIADAGSAPFPGEAVSDVRMPVRADATIRFWLAARNHRALAEAMCSSGSGVVTMHGEAATAFAWAGNTALAETCGSRALLGGTHGDHHVVGVPQVHARQLSLTGVTVGGFVLVEEALALHPARGAPVEVRAMYPVDRYRALIADREQLAVRMEVECHGKRWLVVNNLMAALHPMTFKVESNDAPIAPALATIAAHYFPCSASSPMNVSVMAYDATAVDIFLL